MYQYDFIFDSDSNAWEVCSFFSPGVITLELSANGWPFTLTLYDLVQPKGALLTSNSVHSLSINFSKDNAVDGAAKSELRWAYGYNNNLEEPIFFIDSLIWEMASFATSSVSSFSTAVKQTTTSSIDTGFGSISSADWISFFVGSYEMLSQCNCKILINSCPFNFD